MRTVTDHKSLSWPSAWPCAGAERVIGRNVGNTVQTSGPGTTATRFVGGVQPLPSDMAIGAFTLTLTNLITGSAVQVESQDGTKTLYNGVAAGAALEISLNAYATGSSLNALRIKVRKGTSAPYYQPFETLATAIVGSNSIYIQQLQD